MLELWKGKQRDWKNCILLCGLCMCHFWFPTPCFHPNAFVISSFLLQAKNIGFSSSSPFNVAPFSLSSPSNSSPSIGTSLPKLPTRLYTFKIRFIEKWLACFHLCDIPHLDNVPFKNTNGKNLNICKLKFIYINHVWQICHLIAFPWRASIKQSIFKCV